MRKGFPAVPVTSISLLLLILVASHCLVEPSAAAAERHGGGRAATAGSSSRPPLIRKNGRYFSWAMPKGWHDSESTNGVDMYSPDKKRQAGYYLLLRNPGSTTPEQFLTWICRTLKQRDFRIVSVRRVPSQLPGEVTKEIEYTAVDPSLGPRHGSATIAIINAYGQFNAFWQAISTTPQLWEKDKLWLPVLAREVTITNTAEVAGNNTIIKPRNNPLYNSGLIKSWREKSLSEDRISQARREATMGYERLQSPTTGRIYELPLENYDGTKGGYHNPDQWNEILKKAPTGE